MRAEVVKALDTLQKKSPGGLERAISLLQDTVFSFSMKVCGQREDAEDTMQETLLKAAQYLRRFDNPKALAVWLYKVAKNHCLMSRRKSKFAPKESLSLEALLPDRKALERLADANRPTPETALLGTEARKRLQQAVLQLPPLYRLILVLHDMEGLATDEIARVMSLREGTVRVRLYRARVFVRNKLTAAGGKAPPPRRAPAEKPRRCKELFAALSDYLDGALDPKLCEELEKHLAGCRPCEAFLHSLERTVEQIHQHQPARLDARVAARTRRALLAEYQRALRAALHAKSS
ncbi:MAG TPA: sigma-70 family RNA polymerase sigma factor [Candidatus Xenobia bacterium]|nr:sigma-70 family RNA polymerase sigma factor [Candidatus Xenobia bacterium]